MLSFNEARFQAFSRLNDCKTTHEFLDCLQKAYLELGIGQELDFSQVTCAWQHDAELPAIWRLELFNNTPTQSEYNEFTQGRLFNDVAAKLFDGNFQQSWFAREHLLITLLAPLLTPSGRKKSLGFHRFLISARQNKSSNIEQEFHDTLGTGLLQWADQVAQGHGEWAPVTEWLHQEGREPALLAMKLKSKQQPINCDDFDALVGLRLLLLQVRDSLLLQENRDQQFSKILLQHIEVFNFHVNDDFDLWHNYFGALLTKLVVSPTLNTLISPDAGAFQQRALQDLFMWLDFSTCFTPSNFSEFLSNMSNQQLSSLRLLHRTSQSHPELALIFEQQQYQRCQEIYPQLKTEAALAWYQGSLAEMKAAKQLNFDVVFKHLLCAVEPQQQLQLIVQHLIDDSSFPVAKDLFQQFDDAEQLLPLLTAKNPLLRYQVVARLCELAIIVDVDANNHDALIFSKHPKNWPILLHASMSRPQVFIENYYVFSGDDPSRLAMLWDHAQDDSQRTQLADGLLSQIYHSEKVVNPDLIALLSRLCAETPDYLLPRLLDSTSEHLLFLLKQMKHVESPILRLVPFIVVCLLNEQPFDCLLPPYISSLLNRSLASYPDGLTKLDKKDFPKLFGLLDDSAVQACVKTLSPQFITRSFEVRIAALRLLARCRATVIADSGLLTAPAAINLLTLTAMASALDPDMPELLKSQLAHQDHNDYSRGLSFEALERAGVAIDNLDSTSDDWRALDLATLKQLAAAETIAAAVHKLWDDECASALAPLGEQLGKLLLQHMQAGLCAQPRRARQLLAYLSSQQQHDFALWCLQKWLADKGDELHWLLLSLADYGDKRCAQALMVAVQGWQKKPHKKLPTALSALARLPNNLGLPLLTELKKNRKNSELLINNVKQAITQEARQRGVRPEELG